MSSKHQAVRALAILAVLAGADAGGAADEPRGRFQPRSLPKGAHGHRAHLLGDHLFVFGGYGPGEIVLDVKSGEWSEFASMKVRKVFFGSAVVDGRIHAVGGNGEEPAVVERFDPADGHWKVVLESQKLPKTHFSAAVIGDKIYAVGGFPDEHSGVHVVDARKGTVDDVPAMPGHHRGDHFHYVVNLQGKLHVLGGMRFTDGESGPLGAHWMFDGQRWIERAALPKPSMCKLAAYGVVGGKLYVFNDLDGLHHVYDPKANRWSDEPAPFVAKLVLPAVVVEEDRMHVFGGLDPLERAPSTSVHTYDASANRWQTVE